MHLSLNQIARAERDRLVASAQRTGSARTSSVRSLLIGGQSVEVTTIVDLRPVTAGGGSFPVYLMNSGGK